MRYTSEEFVDFLIQVNLSDYKDKYSKIKTVEMDLPRNIQALDTIYGVYWHKNLYTEYKTPLQFDAFYDVYFENCKENIMAFWYKSGFGNECDCFLRGLKSRIYRTWTSLITQIHAGYVAESVFGKGNVIMNSDLDHKGIDMQINYCDKLINVQIKKVTKRPEIARMHSHDAKIGDVYNIWYVVPQDKDYENPYYKVKNRQGELRDSLKQFVKFNKNGTLDRLENGFVIFNMKEFLNIKYEIDANIDKNNA